MSEEKQNFIGYCECVDCTAVHLKGVNVGTRVENPRVAELESIIESFSKKVETGDCGKYDIFAAIRHLRQTISNRSKNALNVLIWNYQHADESQRLLSETLKKRNIENTELRAENERLSAEVEKWKRLAGKKAI